MPRLGARVPASFFVAISYMCWAYRKGVLLEQGGAITIDGKPVQLTAAA